ncbi:4-(cytidine 5'-diphospho)-2-C-methyl-D-erythritol kinase [Croceicoccus sp. F390]|uniref:4-diphosphocytidyl-2-C-methyl-D-erythritol kinase n=1 Tax=Croceicoccus esteveae TaxID=3075597 RepID=A0ABU2ZI85_9SPHN|nr:4-(cytidine 5'-diphospho)-2-C-methyl-D-erythritol kinase [Croceicoccus sp. F390]MDT0575294.1 4-(cytidine 5'-diphospho)-2-C-methyl-D-erythritol kinase [Croceicoccus sp. F390]
MALAETAYAKINLALHVRKRREDGYHELETLFAFVDDGDRLTVSRSHADRLTVTGEFAPALTDPFGNIVAQALTTLPRGQGWHVTLDKRLPVAAGLGGGSADAGAIFRIVRDQGGLPERWRAKAARLGADVPACVESRTCIGRGNGAELEPAPDDLAGTHVLLVNPRAALSTAEVFAAWEPHDAGGLTKGDARHIATHGRNDLQDAAVRLCPAIDDVLARLRQTGAWLVRMSGSGATCFALFDDAEACRDAAKHLRACEPQWWQMAGRLR